MIKNDGHACLADFSLITLIPNPSTFISACIEGGTYGWMSPELLGPQSFGLEEARPTRESDYYALGMVVYEVLGWKVPTRKHNDFIALFRVVDGEWPERPQGEEGGLLTDDTWDVVECCWKHTPGDRASARDVLECLGKTPSLSRSSSPGIDSRWDSEEGSNSLESRGWEVLDFP
jgi:serine/threonine protein kinase